MHSDTIEPFMAVTKEMELRFSFGYTPAEFAATLQRLADGVPAPTCWSPPGSTWPALPAPSTRCARRATRQDPGHALTCAFAPTTEHLENHDDH